MTAETPKRAPGSSAAALIVTAATLPFMVFALGALGAFAAGYSVRPPTAEGVGYAAGSAFFALVVAAAIAALVRRSSPRAALPVLWLVALGASTCGINTRPLTERRARSDALEKKIALLQERSRRQLERGEDLGDASLEEVETLSRDIEALADTLRSGEADLGRCSARTIRDLFAPRKRYGAALDAITKPVTVLSLAEVKSRDDIDSKVRAIDEFIAANAAMETAFREMRPSYERCGRARGVPEADLAAGLRGFDRGQAQLGVAQRMREIASESAREIRGLLVLVRDAWGRWHFDPSRNVTVFDDDATLKRWVAGTERIRLLSLEEDTTQRELFDAGPVRAIAPM